MTLIGRTGAEHEITVAVAQINAVLGDVDANSQAHKAAIAEARDRGAELLVFPELSLTGYGLGRQVLEAAVPADSPLLADLAAIAGAVRVVVGFVEDAGPGVCYNAAALLHHGSVVAVHRKVNLPTYGGLEEGKWFHRGTTPTIAPIASGWIATHLICADLWNPALVHQAMMNRPDIIVAPINSASGIVSEAFSNEHNWGLAAQFYAMIYGTPLLLANRFGAEGETWFWGGSTIFGPRGDILATAGACEDVITATLDRRQIARARFDLPTLRDAESFT